MKKSAKSVKKSKSSRAVPESEETPALEARSHPVGFLRQAVRDAEKKPGRRSSKKRG